MATADSEKSKRMNKTAITAALQPLLEDARNFIDEDIAPQREKATRYYQGQPFGDEVDGRSKAVSRDVHDAINGILPSLVEVFLADPDLVKYLPRRLDHIPFAEQASDYIPYLLQADNEIFTELFCAFKDALKNKVGFVKWWVEEKECAYDDRYTGMSEAQIQAIIDGKYEGNAQILEKVEIEPSKAPIESVDPNTGEPVPAFDVTLRRYVTEKKFRAGAVPPEEILVHRKTRNSPYSAPIFAHRRYMTVSDACELTGKSQSEILPLAGNGDDFDFNQEREARNPNVDVDKADESPDPSQRLVLIIESWCRMDIDGDGVSELVKITTGGTAYKVLKHEATDEISVGCLSPDPEPHTFFGSCTADVTMDIQRQKSQLLRGLFDSLAQSLNPRTWYVMGQTNVPDLLNNEIGALVGMRAPGMAGEFTTPFVGQSVLPVMEMLDGVVESRTGRTRASAGLDPDALQSTTKAAVSATVQAAQARIKLIARIFAETGMRALYKGYLKMVVKHQDAPRIARLRGKYVEVDPSNWDADMTVHIDTGLGTGNIEEQGAMLMQIAGKQEQILTLLGPTNPLVSPTQYYNTLVKLVRLSRIGLPEEFFMNPAMAPPEEAKPPKGDQENPAAALAQAEIQKAQISAQADLQRAQMAEQTKMRIAAMEDARARDEMKKDLYIELIKAGVQLDVSKIEADLESARIGAQDSLAREEAQRADERERENNEMNAAVAHAGNVIKGNVAREGNAAKADAASKKQPSSK